MSGFYTFFLQWVDSRWVLRYPIMTTINYSLNFYPKCNSFNLQLLHHLRERKFLSVIFWGIVEYFFWKQGISYCWQFFLLPTIFNSQFFNKSQFCPRCFIRDCSRKQHIRWQFYPFTHTTNLYEKTLKNIPAKIMKKFFKWKYDYKIRVENILHFPECFQKSSVVEAS